MPGTIQRMILLVVILVNSSLLAGENLPALIDRLNTSIPKLMADEKVPGLSMVLIRDNRIVWSGCYGVRAAGKTDKVDESTLFEAASMSKPLFTYAALKLVEDKRLNLDVPLDSYLDQPYLADQPQAAEITGRMVMLHRTGLPNWREGGWQKGGPLEVLHQPGTKFTYSGEGYLYLQTAIEKITGQPMADWLDSVLLKPLKMDHSSYVWREALKGNYAGGHDKEGNLKKGRRFYTEGNAAYSLYTTPTDYARFLLEMMNPDRSASYSLQKDLIQQMTTLQVEPEKGVARSCRSLGWVVSAPEESPQWVSHSGTNGSGFRCHSRFDMANQSGSVIMTNSDRGNIVWEAIIKLIDNPVNQAVSVSQEEKFTTWEPVGRTIHYGYRVMNPTPKPSGKLDIYMPLPLPSPRQEIRYLHLSEKGKQRIFTDRHGQKLAHYSIDKLEAGQWFDIGFVAGLTVSSMSWNATGHDSGGSPPELATELRTLYLAAEKNYSMDTSLMRNLAADLTRDAASDYDKLVNIHDYIISKVRYVRDDVWDPAAEVLTRGYGSCSEYNYVLSGLCRLAGLPTRCVGGTSNGFHDLPTTDVVFHRWTEVYLSDYGWFPADCSRDANPIRGKRSHFGRVYNDAIIWCRQAGGDDDTLGWEYRAELRVEGKNPGLKDDHRVRWFEYYPESEVNAAYAWFDGGQAEPPAADLLECALLHWDDVSETNQLKMIEALAGSGRNACLRRAGRLNEENGLRERWVRKLCSSEDLAETILEKSRQLFSFRSWYRSNESRLVVNGDGKFLLKSNSGSTPIATTTDSSLEIWQALAVELADRLTESVEQINEKAVVVMPVEDQTIVGLADNRQAIHSALKNRITGNLQIKLIDEVAFDRFMEEQGPGSKEYWILANADTSQYPEAMVPDVILIPLAITERTEKKTVLYHLEFKVLELARRKYTTITAKRYREKPAVAGPSESGVLIAGGDTVLARWEHDWVGRMGYEWPLSELEPFISQADAALCNLECCVSLRGAPVDKGERCSFYYRARPDMLRCLSDVGMDMVTAANNHGGDYGPDSVADTRMWSEKAGLVCVGIGNEIKVAGSPQLVRVGPVRVAIAGMDMTMPRFAAGENRPGTHYVREELADFAARTRELGEWARDRCDLLALTIHWGSNWVEQTPAIHREMARVAFENGVDVILGHSAHQLQGIEIIDGKAVIYDMGNLLFDCELSPEGKRGGLFRLYLSPDGVQKIEVIPTQVLDGHTVPASYDDAHEVLGEMNRLCAALDTHLLIDEDLEGRPMGVIPIAECQVTARETIDPNLVFATFPIAGGSLPASGPRVLLTPDIPDGATILNPAKPLAPGIELLAYQIPANAKEGGIVYLSTWWRVTGKIKPNIMPAFQMEVNGEITRRGTPWYTRHDLMDWSAPMSQLVPDQVVEDVYPARLAGIPAGQCRVSAVMVDTSQIPENRILNAPVYLGEIKIQAEK